MTRLWEKGLPLSERVLRYTAGEDHLLDARLVPYDVRGSIAHAEMLAATGLISDTDAAAHTGHGQEQDLLGWHVVPPMRRKQDAAVALEVNNPQIGNMLCPMFGHQAPVQGVEAGIKFKIGQW